MLLLVGNALHLNTWSTWLPLLTFFGGLLLSYRKVAPASLLSVKKIGPRETCDTCNSDIPDLGFSSRTTAIAMAEWAVDLLRY